MQLDHHFIKRLALITTISVSLLLTSCRYDNREAELKSISVAHAKFILANSKSENNLITKIDNDNRFYTIHFELGDPITIQIRLINKIEYDSVNWVSIFYFNDYTHQAAFFIGKLNFGDNDITLNPYLTSALTAIAKIKTPVKGKFKVVVKGKPSEGISIENIFEPINEEHELPILGLYENYNNQVEFIFMSENDKVRCSKVVAIQTVAMQNRPTIEIVKNQLSHTYNGLYFISNLKLGFDQTGEVRWYYTGDGTSFFGKLKNGNFIASDATNKYFFEVTMLGQQVKKYLVPNALHHEIVEMPSGNFLVASHSPPGAPHEDVTVEVSRSTGIVTKSWDFNTILDPLRKTLPDAQAGDWLHINALYYDETDNSIVVSCRSQCAVVKIDYSTSAIKWIFGNHNEWSSAFVPFLLKPIDSNGNEVDASNSDFWNYGQHAIQKLSDGNLLIYDNGDYRGFYDDPSVPQRSYTRIAEYKIDETTKTVELVWHFDNNKSVFTQYTGYTQDLDGTRLAAYMWVSENTPRIVEVNSKDEIIYDATINRGKVSYYRTLKVDVYAGID